ncbi:hypothetical protein L915_22044 [Phytophthora nicotianae]|uniref:Uncharacterized protein n=2 Tax=Phytophthora nicotianae TaxID=4792 RepID=W2FJ09_PHYNI|nr:hypothetical protein L915_22044 [Phytophthora nicotianae]
MTHLGDGYQAGYMSSVIVPPREGHEAMEALQDEGTATEVPLPRSKHRGRRTEWSKADNLAKVRWVGEIYGAPPSP